jgi:hypothetical protein
MTLRFALLIIVMVVLTMLAVVIAYGAVEEVMRALQAERRALESEREAYHRILALTSELLEQEARALCWEAEARRPREPGTRGRFVECMKRKTKRGIKL